MQNQNQDENRDTNLQACVVHVPGFLPNNGQGLFGRYSDFFEKYVTDRSKLLYATTKTNVDVSLQLLLYMSFILGKLDSGIMPTKEQIDTLKNYFENGVCK